MRTLPRAFSAASSPGRQRSMPVHFAASARRSACYRCQPRSRLLPWHYEIAAALTPLDSDDKRLIEATDEMMLLISPDTMALPICISSFWLQMPIFAIIDACAL